MRKPDGCLRAAVGGEEAESACHDFRSRCFSVATTSTGRGVAIGPDGARSEGETCPGVRGEGPCTSIAVGHGASADCGEDCTAVAVAPAGDARADGCGSGIGLAQSCLGLATTLDGDAWRGECVTMEGATCGSVLAAPHGDASAADCPSVTNPARGLGPARCFQLAVAGGDATSGSCASTQWMCMTLGVSVFGHAEGDHAVSVFGDADGDRADLAACAVDPCDALAATSQDAIEALPRLGG